MTVAELREYIQTGAFGGIKALTNKQLELYQKRAFGWMLELCEPVNLLVSYDDGNIYKAFDDGWFLKNPIIAKSDDEWIDVDSRLDMAFVDIVISFLCKDIVEGQLYEQKAYRRVFEYANEVLKLGYNRAKDVYEGESFISGVRYDCEYRYYEVDRSLVELCLKCILKEECGELSKSEFSFLKSYKEYIAGRVQPSKREKLQAVDREIHSFLAHEGEMILSYSKEKLQKVTTLFEEFNSEELSEFAKRSDIKDCDG